MINASKIRTLILYASYQLYCVSLDLTGEAKREGVAFGRELAEAIPEMADKGREIERLSRARDYRQMSVTCFRVVEALLEMLAPSMANEKPGNLP